jgi:hypothetical protein
VGVGVGAVAWRIDRAVAAGEGGEEAGMSTVVVVVDE